MTRTTIMLASGATFDILNPAASGFTLFDIAHGLGRVCRFAGQTNRFYSVAEHCVHVARIIPVELGRAALLHDAAEAFIGDVTSPLKALLPDYRAIEAQVEAAIVARFLSPAEIELGGIAHDMIKQADRAMCIAEARELMPAWPGYDRSDTDIDPAVRKRALDHRFQFDKPEYASASWLRSWHRYSHWLADRETRGEAA